MRIAPVFLVPLLLLASSRAEAASVSFVIDLSFPFEPIPESSLAVRGSFLEAGRFDIDSSLLPDGTINFVPFDRFDAFSLTLPVLSLGADDLARGSCGTGVRPPCGILFVGMEPLTLVGAFDIRSADGTFSVGLGNTDVTRLNPDPLFQSITIFDFDPSVRVVAASGFATVRPVPEPSSLLLLLTGGLAVRRAVRNRRRSAGAA